MNLPTILILRPWKHWGIVTAVLKRVASLGRYMQVEGMMKSDFVDAEATTLRHIAVLCEELQPDSLYQRYANKKVFRRVKDFWETTDNTVKQYVKRMADRRLSEVVRLSTSFTSPYRQGIPKTLILYRCRQAPSSRLWSALTRLLLGCLGNPSTTDDLAFA